MKKQKDHLLPLLEDDSKRTNVLCSPLKEVFTLSSVLRIGYV